jgi:periplasmic copper chaperone A
VFKALQTYESGEVVRWIEETPPGGEEPEFPAPVLKLTAPEGKDGGDEKAGDVSVEVGGGDDEDSNTLAVIALVVGALGLVAGVGGIVLARRRPTS